MYNKYNENENIIVILLYIKLKLTSNTLGNAENNRQNQTHTHKKNSLKRNEAQNVKIRTQAPIHKRIRPSH